MRSSIKAALKPVLRLPGAYEFAWTILAALQKRKPYNGLWEDARQWIHDAEKSKRISSFNGRSLLLYTDLPNWSAFCVAMAGVLVGLGYKVDLLWTSHASWTPFTNSNLLRFAEWSKSYKIPKLHERLNIIEATSIPAMPLSQDTLGFIEQQSIFDTRYNLMRELVDFEPGTQAECMLEFRRKRNKDFAARLNFLLTQNDYDGALTPNGSIWEFATFHYLTRKSGLTCTTFEFLEAPESIVVSQEQPVMQIDTSSEWKKKIANIEKSGVKSRVAALLSAREKTGSVPGSTFIYHQTSKSSRDELFDKLKLDQNKSIFLMCPNCIGDAIMLEQGRCFVYSEDWICKTLDYFARRQDAQLILRAHPGEVLFQYYPRVDQIVINHFQGKLPSNIRLISSEEKLNTYGLMDISNGCLVFNSTVGMEMAARGKQTIVAARAHYDGKGFTHDPRTETEYFTTLNQWCDQWKELKLSPVQVELAWAYLDMYYNDWPKQFPWHANTFTEDLKIWPLKKVLSAEGRERFQKTFDYLAMRAI